MSRMSLPAAPWPRSPGRLLQGACLPCSLLSALLVFPWGLPPSWCPPGAPPSWCSPASCLWPVSLHSSLTCGGVEVSGAPLPLPTPGGSHRWPCRLGAARIRLLPPEHLCVHEVYAAHPRACM